MSYSAEQVKEKGHYSKYHKKVPKKTNKKFQHRRMRQKMKDLDFVPQYNRYEAGWECWSFWIYNSLQESVNFHLGCNNRVVSLYVLIGGVGILQIHIKNKTMPTRIFGVEYWITETIGKVKPTGRSQSDTIKESKNVAASTAQAAIDKAKLNAEKPYAFTDEDDKGKMVKYKVTRSKFELINVILRAEADY